MALAARGALRGYVAREAAIVAHQLARGLMVGEGDVAIGASWCPAARGTLKHLGEAAPVLEEDGLLSRGHGLAHGGHQLGRQWPAHHLAVAQVLDVDNLYLRQLHSLEAPSDGDESKLARERVVVGLDAGRGRAEKRLRPHRLRHDDGHGAGMVAGRGVLLLVAVLVLLVDNHQSEPLEGQEHCRACAENHVVGLVGELFPPNLYALGVAVFAVVDAQAVAEDTFQPRHHLHGECDFGQQVKHLLAFADGFLYEVNVDFGLAARRHAVEKHHVLILELSPNVVVGLLLDVVERVGRVGGHAFHIEPAHLLLVGGQRAPLYEQVQHGRRGVALVEQLLTGDFLYRLDGGGSLQTVPMAEAEEDREQMVLGCGAVELAIKHAQPLLGAKVGGKCHVLLRAWLVLVGLLESGGEGGHHHVAERRHVIVGYPLPDSQLVGQEQGTVVEQPLYLAALELRLRVVEANHDTHVELAAAQRHEHTAPLHGLRLEFRGDEVSEHAVNG